MEIQRNEGKSRRRRTGSLLGRRELLRWLGLAAAGGGALTPAEILAQANHLAHQLRKKDRAEAGFLTREQKKIVVTLCDRIIPADSDSPGAREAGVPDFVDGLLKVSDRGTHEVWRKGLDDLNGFSNQKYGGGFTTLGAARQESLLRVLAENEFHPQSALDRFFVEAKRLMAMGDYTSAVGLQKDLKFQGNGTSRVSQMRPGSAIERFFLLTLPQKIPAHSSSPNASGDILRASKIIS